MTLQHVCPKSQPLQHPCRYVIVIWVLGCRLPSALQCDRYLQSFLLASQKGHKLLLSAEMSASGLAVGLKRFILKSKQDFGTKPFCKMGPLGQASQNERNIVHQAALCSQRDCLKKSVLKFKQDFSMCHLQLAGKWQKK